MKLTLDINNQTKNRLDKKFIRKVILATLEKSGLKFLNNKEISISLAFVGSKEIKKLNRIYRSKNKATDVLSFAEYKNTASLKKERKSGIFLGELVVCPDDVKYWSVKNKLDYKKELARVISHGLLHLLGLKHGKKMFEIQNFIVKKI